jgi:hypothetical protein
MSLATCQLVLKTAFLNAALEEEVYVKPLHDMQYILLLLLGRLVSGEHIRQVVEVLRGLRGGGVLKLKKRSTG